MRNLFPPINLIFSTCYSVLCCCIILSINPSFAENNDYSLQELVQLPNNEENPSKWTQLTSHPSNKHQYFISNQQGQIFIVDQETNAQKQLVLDINNQQLKTQSNKNDVLELTYFTLHPNFALREKTGFATLYSAHIEKSNKLSKTKRIQERNSNLTITFDAVITEWKLKPSTQSQYTALDKREVLRISLPNNQHGINQLSFNPFTKSWNQDFGLLYMSLNASQEFAKFPLYSGVILRIDPNKLGLRSYSTPPSNPFLLNNDIRNEIYTLGAQHIKQFIWPDKNKDQLLISHRYNTEEKQQQWLSYSNSGEDWRKHPPKHFIYRNVAEIEASNLMLYRGRNAPELHNKLLFLRKQRQHWQLKSLSHKQQAANKQTTLESPLLVWQFNQHLSATDEFSFYNDGSGEMIVFNKSEDMLYQLFQKNIDPILQSDTKENKSSAGIYFFFIILLTMLSWYLYYQAKVRKHSSKALVRRQYANISLDEKKLELSLFKRHQKVSETFIKLADISLCQVLLAENCICTINTELGHGFSNEKEQELREIFKKEHADKMIDDKVRRISLVLEDNKKQSHTTCLYLRKGNDRITKKSYYQVIDDLMDWCWLIAKEINSQQTGIRKCKPAISAAEKDKAQHKIHDDTPLHKQAAAIRPMTHDANGAPYPVVELETPSKTKDFQNATAKLDEQKAIKLNSPVQNPGIVDTELVNALEKLVNLKQQGFLSDVEFAQAKAKLLKNLIEK